MTNNNRDYRRRQRSKRILFDHTRGIECIRHDYLDPRPQFKDKYFEIMFRISSSRFQRIMDDIGGRADLPFYQVRDVNSCGHKTASMEARLLLPLKCLAYGVPPHTFTDYFQMSRTLARKCTMMFDDAMSKVYMKEYLRHPTATDLLSIVTLHKHVHGVDGMFVCLDCMHTVWKNCPYAWKGSYEGKGKTYHHP